MNNHYCANYYLQLHCLLVQNQIDLLLTFQQYNFVKSDSSAYSIYGFPTASETFDYIKHSGEAGRVLNIFAVVKGKNSFFVSYSNNKQSFNKLLPELNEIVKSIVILK